MTKWFGKSWGAPCCEEDEHLPTPVGQPCLKCGKAIAAGDQGVLMPMVWMDKRATVEAQHLDCFLKSILPHGPDCERCRGLERESHKWSCSYRKHGGDCDCLRVLKKPPESPSS
jgi:hypothetical protein